MWYFLGSAYLLSFKHFFSYVVMWLENLEFAQTQLQMKLKLLSVSNLPGVLFGVVVGGFVVASVVTLESENVIFPFFGMFKVNVNISPSRVIEWLGMIAGFLTFPLQLAVDFLLLITPLQTTSLKVQLIVLLPAFTSPFTLTTL